MTLGQWGVCPSYTSVLAVLMSLHQDGVILFIFVGYSVAASSAFCWGSSPEVRFSLGVIAIATCVH
jgi:hypothetical protein